MSIQDRLERILRELLIMVSKAPMSNAGSDYVLVHKKEMQQQLGCLRDVVREMMDQYEATEESRNRGTLEVQKQREQIIRNANHQAQDIYAASVLYTEEALGKIQNIINEAELASKMTMDRLKRDMEEERRRVRSNQNELLTQLEDLKDTGKYMRLIEDRNREIAKAKAKKEENLRSRRYNRKAAASSVEQTENNETEEGFTPIRPQIRVNEEYLRKLGYMQDEPLEEAPEANVEVIPEEISENVSEETFTELTEDRSEELAAEIMAGIAREISAEMPAGMTEETSAQRPAVSDSRAEDPAGKPSKPPGRRKKKRFKNAQKQYGNMKEISAEDVLAPEDTAQEEDILIAFDDDDDKIVYEKPVIKVNPEYFEKINKQKSSEQNESAKEEHPSGDTAENRGKRQEFFQFWKKS